MQTRALVDFGELSLNRAMRVYGPVGDLSVVEGRYYPSKAPLMSFAAVPVYAVLRAAAGGVPGAVPEIPLVFFSRIFLTVLPTLLSLALVERLLAAYVDRKVALAVTLTYALGTLAFSYSLLFMSHQTTATLLLAGFYLSWRVARRERSDSSLILCGLFLGLAVVAEYTSALPAFAISVYATYAGATTPRGRLRTACLLSLGIIPTAVLLGWYHHRCFGGVLETGYRHLADVAYQPWHQGGFLGIKTPTWIAFSRSFFSPLRGLFALSPFLLIGFGGLSPLWKARREHDELRAIALFTALLCAAYVYFTSSFSYESWGWTTGPRHLTGLVPFLLLPSALLVSQSKSVVGRGAVLGTILSSILVTSALTFVNYIPDDVSEGVFGLFVPLASTGHVVPTVLNFLGAHNPAAGYLPIGLAVAVGGLAAGILLVTPRLRVGIVAGVLAATFLGLHFLAAGDTDHDRAAQALLKRVWLSPPGLDVTFWSTSGRSH
jgi:4-amino-4-deoxy-L-arabinose transferase-like glycosyltransferase